MRAKLKISVCGGGPGMMPVLYHEIPAWPFYTKDCLIMEKCETDSF